MSKLSEALAKAERDKSGRGTGKTHKMLQHALAAAISGQTVFVMGQDRAQVMDLMKHMIMFKELAQLGPNTHTSFQAGDIQLPSPMGRVQFRSIDHPEWSWDALQMKGYPHGMPTYVDHYVYEQRLLESQKGAKK